MAFFCCRAVAIVLCYAAVKDLFHLMKAYLPFVLAGAVLWVPAVPPAAAAPLAAKVASSSSFPQLSAKDWADTAAVQKKLGAALLPQAEKLSKATGAAARAAELPLLQWQLAHADGTAAADCAKFKEDKERELADKERQKQELSAKLAEQGGADAESTRARIAKLDKAITELQHDLARPLTFAGVLEQEGGAELISKLTNNAAWLKQILFSGECGMPARVLDLMLGMGVLQAETPLERDTITATALEYGRYGWSYDRALARAAYLCRHAKAGELNAEFATLPFFHRRVVCGWKGNHSSGFDESFEWCLKNVHLPAQRYTGACWRCGYVLDNVYGDSVHGEDYYTAFAGMYDENHHRFTKEVGGVCGSLSHFGASAACANGVPALTAGEPAHCSYIVLVNGKWTPAYSLDWDRGLHWQPFRENYKFSSLHLADALYIKNTKRMAAADRSRMLAALWESNGKTKQAAKEIRSATKACPLHYIAWRERAALLERTAAPAADWKALEQELCDKLVTDWPELGAELLLKHVYPAMRKAVPDHDPAAVFWAKVKFMGPDRWKMEDLLNAQVDYMTPRLGADKAAASVYRTALKHTMNNARVHQRVGSAPTSPLRTIRMDERYAPVILGWGNSRSEGMSPEGQRAMLAVMTEVLSKTDGGGEEAKAKLIGTALNAAAKMHDAATYTKLAAMIGDRPDPDVDMVPEVPTLPDKLLSEGGMVTTSSTCGYDKPAAHPALLTPAGGSFHTGNEKRPWVCVELPKLGYVTGVVIVATPQNVNFPRVFGMQVQYSETGRDDDWHNVGANLGEPTDRIIKVDVSDVSPKAKFIRLIRDTDVSEFFHLNGIYVYGKQAS